MFIICVCMYPEIDIFDVGLKTFSTYIWIGSAYRRRIVRTYIVHAAGRTHSLSLGSSTSRI
jgi:hypothetical protein